MQNPITYFNNFYFSKLTTILLIARAILAETSIIGKNKTTIIE